MPAAVLASTLALALASDPADTAPADTAPAPLRLDLRAVLERAIVNYPELAVVAAEHEGAKALQQQAKWARYTPKLTDTMVFGVVPGAEGSILESPDTNRDLNDFGPFWRLRLEAQMPLYTFGRLSGAENAAKALVESKTAKASAKRSTACALAAKAYFGWLRANESIDLLSEIRGHVDELLEKLENPGEDEEEPDAVDLYRARNHRAQIDRLTAEASRLRTVAAAGLTELVLPEAGTVVRPAPDKLVALEAPEPDLEAGLAEALEANPELQEARSAAHARSLYAESVAKDALPMLGIDARYEYGEAPGREAQENPFVYEPFNVRSIQAAFGVRWDLNFLQTGARTRKERADAAELRARAAALAVRLRVDLQERHARLVTARAAHEAARRSVSLTANWLRVAEENQGLGSASVKDVLDAYLAWIQARNSHLDAVQELDLALIDWRLGLGRPPLLEGEAP